MSLKTRCVREYCEGYPHFCDKCAIVKYVKNEVKVTSAKENMMLSDEVTVKVGNQTYRARQAEWRQSYGEYPELDLSLYLAPYNRIQTPELSIKDVIFNPPATIVFWSDNTKTVVKCDYECEAYDPEKGIAMAISRKMLGDNKYDYYNVFRHWLKKWEKQNPESPTIDDFFVDGEW